MGGEKRARPGWSPNCTRSFRLLLLGLLIATGVWEHKALATPPLHERIDELVAARAGGELGPLSDDAEFMRRAYLDFAGRVPSVTEARAFLAETASDKRQQLIDRLTDSPDYVDHMTEFLHVMLMERLGDDEAWQTFLQASLAENKPWDQMVREMVYPDPADEMQRGAAFFITKRLEKYGQNPVDMPGLVRDVGRLFLGVDVQCAECHDHLFVDDYKQQTYQGLFAFVGHTFIRRDVKFPAVGEKLLTKKVDFKSVFVMEDLATGPKLLDAAEVEIPALAKGEEYLVPPDKKTKFPGTPKFSPLQILAAQLPRRGNHAFEKNIVNRLWWKLMGRGLVEPLDLHHSQNPPSHPQVMALLVDEFGQHEFDMKWMLRQLARSQTYQRSSRLALSSETSVDTTDPAPSSYRRGLERPLSAEQLLASVWQATGPAAVEASSAAAATSEEQPVASESNTSVDTPSVKTPADEPAAAPPVSLETLREKFTAVLANPPREPEITINPTVKAALFLMNDVSVLQLLVPRDDNLIGRLAVMDDNQLVADELYLSVLSRQPTAEEQLEVAEYLADHVDARPDALADLAWALLASTEFCVNH